MLLTKLKKEIKEKLPPEWTNLEVETILMQLGLEGSLLNRDSINVLKILTIRPELYFEDIIFFMYSSVVMNNEEVDFGTVSMPTSLEIALAVHQVADLLEVPLHSVPKFSQGVIEVVKYVLVNEGYSEVLPPFDVFGVTGLTEGQTAKDTLDKKKAIELYVSAMYS